MDSLCFADGWLMRLLLMTHHRGHPFRMSSFRGPYPSSAKRVNNMEQLNHIQPIYCIYIYTVYIFKQLNNTVVFSIITCSQSTFEPFFFIKNQHCTACHSGIEDGPARPRLRSPSWNSFRSSETPSDRRSDRGGCPSRKRVRKRSRREGGGKSQGGLELMVRK